MRVHYIKHSLYWIQIKLFLYSNNRSEQTTKFVLHCLVAALGSGNNKNSKILKRSNELYVEKRMRLSKHIQPEKLGLLLHFSLVFIQVIRIRL